LELLELLDHQDLWVK
jgi:hypothetical protein